MSNDMDELKSQVAELQDKLETAEKKLEQNYYFSDAAVSDPYVFTVPENGMPAKIVKTQIENNHELDFNNKLNTSSYVNVSFE